MWHADPVGIDLISKMAYQTNSERRFGGQNLYANHFDFQLPIPFGKNEFYLNCLQNMKIRNLGDSHSERLSVKMNQLCNWYDLHCHVASKLVKTTDFNIKNA